MLKTLARAALKPAAAALDLLRPPPAGVTVLIYHRVGAGSGGQVDLDAAVFDDQMAHLASTGSVVTLDDAVELLAGNGSSATSTTSTTSTISSSDRVVVTFDDGTPDVIDHALPILEKHRIPITLYLATAFIEEQRGFWQPTDRPLTWQGAEEAVSTGLVTVGSHTHNHALLDRLPAGEIADELDRSTELIESRLGVTARHFAYPKALAPSPEADRQVRARFASAAIAGTRPNPYDTTDVHLLRRSPVQRSDGMVWFRKKAAGGMGLEDLVRDKINERRYADASR